MSPPASFQRATQSRTPTGDRVEAVRVWLFGGIQTLHRALSEEPIKYRERLFG
jgi:hypothetical protein